jgi:hypothetical protein
LQPFHDLLLPRVSLSALFPELATRFISRHGGTMHRSRRIAALEHSIAGWHTDGAGPFAQVIVAHFEWEPIVTIWLTYPPTVRFAQPMPGVAGGCAQWLFDHGQPGLIAAVISARG